MKKLKITSLTTAALATTILATANLNNHSVKADTINDQTAAKAQTPKEIAQTNVDNAEKAVENAKSSADEAQNNLDSAKNQAKAATDNYNKQSAIVSEAQANVNVKSTAVNKAQTEVNSATNLVSESKDSNKVKAANDAVNESQKAVVEANTNKNNADQAVADKNTEITEKSKVVDKAQKVVDQATTAKSVADRAVSEAEDALNGTGIIEAKTALDKVNKTVGDDNAALVKAKSDRDTKQSAYNDAKKEKDTAETNLTTAKKSATEAKNKFDQLKETYHTYEEKIQSKENQLKDLEEATKNTIAISDVEKYKKAYTDYINGGLTQDDLDFLAADAKKNSYKESKAADDNKEVDLNNLSESDIEKLNRYSADLISKVRNQFGWNDVEVTNGSIKFTQDILKGYAEDYKNGKWTWGWHDSAMINKVAAEYDLPTINDGINQPYEDLDEGDGHTMSSSEPFSADPVTLNSIKRTIYNSLIKLILPTSKGNVSPGKSEIELGHARGVLGISRKEFADAGDQLVGVAVGNLGSTPVTFDGSMYNQTVTSQVHFINIPKSVVEYTDNKKIGLTPLTSYKDQKEKLNQEINDEKNNAPVKQSDLKTYRKDYEDKEKVVSSTQNELNNVTTKFNTANDELSKATNLFATIETRLSQEKQLQTQAKLKYDNLTKNKEKLADDLAKAQAQQSQAEEELSNAKAKKIQAENALENVKRELVALQNNVKAANEKVNNAKDNLKATQQKVADLKNAPSILEEANKSLETAKKDLKSAQDKLEQENEKLAELDKIKQAADIAVSDAQDNLDAANSKVKEAMDKLENSQAALANQESIIAKVSNNVNNKDQSSKKENTASVGNTKVTKPSKATDVKLTHNSFIYDKNGKVVREKLHIKFIRRGKTVKLWKTKIVTIKGKKYYQIGKNQFIKVANTRIKTHSVKIKAVLKGKKHIKAVNRRGKFNGKVIKPGKLYHFNEKLTIKGKTYYKITGTNNWIPVSKLKIKK